MNPFNPTPNAWAEAMAMIISIAAIAYGLWVLWSIFEAVAALFW